MTSPGPSEEIPRILLVEDDPISRAFLSAAVQALPAIVDAADNVAAAMLLASSRHYHLWLFDAHLPDGTGAELLARLRVNHPTTPALAHTAAHDADIIDSLIAQGFRQVLVKPLPASAVQLAVRQQLGGPGTMATTETALSPNAPAAWDDEAATKALNGNREHIAALRDLFLAELPAVHERVGNAFRNEDFAGLHAELHRLRASCGFVGAMQLGQAAKALGEDERSPLRLQEFEAAAQVLMEQIERSRGDGH